MSSFGFSVAGLSVEVAGPGAFRQREHFAPTGPATLRLRSEFTAEVMRPKGQAIIECDTWAAFAGDDSLSLVSQLRSWSPREVARVDLDSQGRDGRLLIRTGLEVDPLDYPLDQLLTIHLLQKHGGLLLHAACVVSNGRAFVVAGPSGEGKTTFARAASQHSELTVLTDERVVLRKCDGQWFAYGTPWVGEGRFSDAGSAPLSGIFLLKKSDRDELTVLSPIRALASLVGCHFPAGWIGDTASQLEPLEELVADVRCSRLRTRLGGDALELVLESESESC